MPADRLQVQPAATEGRALPVDGLRLGNHPLEVAVARDGTVTATIPHPGVAVEAPSSRSALPDRCGWSAAERQPPAGVNAAAKAANRPRTSPSPSGTWRNSEWPVPSTTKTRFTTCRPS